MESVAYNTHVGDREKNSPDNDGGANACGSMCPFFVLQL